MDIFKNTIIQWKFSSTNAIWNNLGLNLPWSVGYTSFLIEQKRFDNKEEWEEYYYKSGGVRNEQLKELAPEIRNILENYSYPRGNIYSLEKNIKNINFFNGRTKEQLKTKAIILMDNLKNKINFSIDEVFECVRFRVICETWNGIIIREHNTVKVLKQIFPDLNFEKKNCDFDYSYAVDYEIYQDSDLICGIQIKPKSYNGNASYLKKAKKSNENKNLVYSNEFGRDVYYIISSHKGEIINKEIIENIRVLLE